MLQIGAERWEWAQQQQKLRKNQLEIKAKYNFAPTLTPSSLPALLRIK